MTLAKIALPTAAILLAGAQAPSAFAQAAPPAPAIAPPAWTVSSDDTRGRVRISATAKGGAVDFVGGCTRAADPKVTGNGFVGSFANYRGTGLRTDGQVENVAFYVRGAEWQEAFAVQIRYSAANRAWEIARPLAPVFLSSFSRGGTLAVVNSRIEEIFSFDLTGSTAAVRAMRTVCGFEP